MQYTVIAIDKENSEQLRLDNRGPHLDHLKKMRENMLLAGPFLNEQGKMCGSLLVFNDVTKEELQNWLDTDPYTLAGLFQSVEIKPFKKVI